MDDVLFGTIIKYIALCSGALGVLIGIDLLAGARIIAFLKRTLDHAVINIDNSVVDQKSRFLLGLFILSISVLMVALVSRLNV
jgi:hypothetical protein